VEQHLRNKFGINDNDDKILFALLSISDKLLSTLHDTMKINRNKNLIEYKFSVNFFLAI